MKSCRVCQEEKPLDDFYKNAARKDGYQTVCKECDRAAARKYWHGLSSEKRRDKHYKRFYGMSFDCVQELLEQQEGKCAICEDELIEFHVDHNHNTGAVRGLLCVNCNTGLGQLKDSVSVLSSAIAYLNTNGSYERQSTRGAETSP